MRKMHKHRIKWNILLYIIKVSFLYNFEYFVGKFIEGIEKISNDDNFMKFENGLRKL